LDTVVELIRRDDVVLGRIAEQGVPTSARPGKLVRGRHSTPA
jgi:hypothetical protein